MEGKYRMDEEAQPETQKSNAETESSDRDGQSATRRRLLKAGAASVPVVVTLQSGTAWAQSVTCAVKQAEPGYPRFQEALDQMVDNSALADREEAKDEFPYQSDEQLESDWAFYRDNYNPSLHDVYLRYAQTSCWNSISTNA